MNQKNIAEALSEHTNLYDVDKLGHNASRDSYADRLDNIEGYGEDSLRNMLENYCKNVLGYTQAQIKPLLADLSKQFAIHNGQQWLDGNPDTKAPYEYAHRNQWRLIEAQNGYLALEREVGNDARFGSLKWIIKARSNPPGMSSDNLLKKDLQFFRDLETSGLRVLEDGTALRDYERNKERRARRKKIILISALIGGLASARIGGWPNVLVDNDRSEKGQPEQLYETDIGRVTVGGANAETPNVVKIGQEQEEPNQLYTDIDAGQELGTVTQRENLLERQFKVNSKSWGLGIVGLTNPAEQSGSRFDITDGNDWGGQPNIQFFMELFKGHDGQAMLKLFSDPGIPVAKLIFSEVEVTLFPKGREPHSFVVRVPAEGYTIPYSQAYSGGVRLVTRNSRDIPSTYITLGADYLDPRRDGGHDNLRSFPFSLSDIERVHYRLSTFDQSSGVIFEAVRAESSDQTPNLGRPE